MNQKKIRVGFLINSEIITAWNYHVIMEILKFNFIEVPLIVTRESTKNTKSFAEKIKLNKSKLSWIVYQKLDAKIFSVSPNAFENKNIKHILPSANYISVRPKETKFSDRIKNSDLKIIKEYNIDLFIRFGFRILRGEILNLPIYGVWSYHHGDSQINRGGPAGYWEVAERWNRTGATLQILTENLDGGTILAKCYSATNRNSLIRNKNSLYWNAVSMLPDQLNKLHSLGSKKYFEEVAESNLNPVFYYNRIYKKPSNFKTVLVFLGIIQKKLKDKFWRVFNFEQWVILYAFSSSKIISKSFFRFKKLMPPKDRFWADPFILNEDDRYFLFIEELIYKNKKGHISVFELDQYGNYTKPTPIVVEDYHLSYPYVFKYENNHYLIPESKKNKSIDLYRCEKFPYQWKKINTLLSGIEAVDTTLHYSQGLWWMFVSVKNNDGASSNDQLSLYYSTDFNTSKWTPHPLNPIVKDVANARSAGKIFNYNGTLFRPSQNCSKRYGHGIKINKIETLNVTEYKESEVQEILPEWERAMVGVHTINHVGNLTVIDGLLKRSKFF